VNAAERSETEEPPRQRILGLWRSPLRSLWLTSVFSVVLLGGMILLIVTGLLSYAAYNPWLGALNDHTPDKGILGFSLFDWPANPSWLFRLNQAIHVTLGIVIIPVVLAKLWSVLPKLFLWPPVRSVAQALERPTLLLLVGGLLFEIVTGLLNIQYWYAFPFSFYSAHFYGAWITIAAFFAHVALKLPHMIKGLRSRSFRTELRTPLEATHPDDVGDDELVASDPRLATISRRGLLGAVGAGSAALLVTTVGQTLGGRFATSHFWLHGAATKATAQTTFRSTRPPPTDTSSRRRPVLRGAFLLQPQPAPWHHYRACSYWSLTCILTNSRSRVSRAGRPFRGGRGSDFEILLLWWEKRNRTRCWWSRSSKAVPSGQFC